MSRRAPRATPSEGSRTPQQRSLRLQDPPGRLAALLREHGHLLKKIEREKKSLAQLDERIQELARRLSGEQTLMAESGRLDDDIHALFAELLSRKETRHARQTRRLVVDVYQALQQVGILSFRDPLEDGGAGEADVPELDAGPLGPKPERDGASIPIDAGGFSARRPGGEPTNQPLRGLFRDLALALHPDRVHDPEEKARRTEVMKEISRAYGEGDLARLLALKRVWLAGGTVTENVDETDRQCANADRMNAGLRDQLKELREELKELRRSPPAQLLKAVARSSDRDRGDPVTALLAQVRDEVERLREVREFVASFRDGKITVEEFARGPQSIRGETLDDEDHAILDALVEGLFGRAEEAPSRPRRKGRRRQPRRDVRPGEVPF